MSTIFAILHVVTAVFIVGPMAILPMTAMRSLRAGQAGQVRTLAKSTIVFTLLSLITFIAGFGLLGAGVKNIFGITWVWLSIVLYVVAFVVALVLVVPAMRRAATQLEASDTATQTGGYGMIAGGSGIVSLLLLAVVVLMVWKP